MACFVTAHLVQRSKSAADMLRMHREAEFRRGGRRKIWMFGKTPSCKI
ncbi:hypothetical protein X975_19942, partial [Stegodyphus mimosarum]